MAYVRLTHSSASLGAVDVGIFFPAPERLTAPPDPRNPFHKTFLQQWRDYDKNERFPVLWLLHGGNGNYSDWPLESMNHRICVEKKLVVVMPNFANPYNTVKGSDYQRYLTQELPEFIRFLLPVSDKREDNFLAGLSYGGYFAYMTALNYPDRYACVGSFSSPLNVRRDVEIYHNRESGYPLPEEIDGSRFDVLHLASQLKAQGRELPRMFQACGTEDFTWDFNVEARDHFRALGLDHTWMEWPGIHNFDFWDVALKKYLDWLPLAANAGKEEA